MVQAKEAIPGMTPGAIVPQSDQDVEPGFTPTNLPPAAGAAPPIANVQAKPTIHGTEDDRAGLSSWAPELNRLYDTTTGKAVRLDYKDMHQALLEGRVGFRKGESIPMIGTDGASYNMPAENVNAAIQSGYRLEHPTEIAVREFRAENKGISGSAKAFLTNFADEALFGVPGVIYNHSDEVTDLERAKLQALKHDNAIANAAGGIAGFGASMLYGGELFQFASKGGRVAEGLVLKGAEKLLAREGEELATKTIVGKMVEAGVEKAAAEKLAPGLVAKTAANMAKLGVEGAIVNAPKEITEAYYDPVAAAEHTAVALGAGAGLGFITGPLGSKFINMSKGLVQSFPEQFEALRPGNLVARGAGAERASTAKAGGLDRLNAYGKIMMEQPLSDGNPVIYGTGFTRRNVFQDRVAMLKEESGEEIGSILKQLDEKTSGETDVSKRFNLNEALDKLKAYREEFLDPNGKIEPIRRKEVKALDRIISTVESRELDLPGLINKAEGNMSKLMEIMPKHVDFVMDPAKIAALGDRDAGSLSEIGSHFITFEEAQNLKKLVGDATKWDFRIKDQVNAVNQKAYSILRDGLDDAVVKGAEKIDSGLAARYMQVKENYAAAEEIGKLLVNAENRSSNKLFGLTDDLVGGFAGVAGVAKAIAAGHFAPAILWPILTVGGKKVMESTWFTTGVAKTLQRLTKDKSGLLFAEQAIKYGAEQLDRITPEFMSNSIGKVTPSTGTLSAIGRFIGNPGINPKTAAERQKLFDEVSAKLNEFTLNQKKSADQLARLTTPIGSFGAPKISQAYMAQMLKTYQYLQSILPNANKELNPFKKNVSQLSDKELADFDRALRVVDNPYSIFNSLQNGTLTQGEVDVLSNLYPNIYSGMQKKITEVAYAQTDKSIPFDMRMKYSLLLGVPLDGSLNNTAAYQANFSKPAQKAPAGGKLNLITPKSNPYATPVTKALMK